jgi:hypothetical protein
VLGSRLDPARGIMMCVRDDVCATGIYATRRVDGSSRISCFLNQPASRTSVGPASAAPSGDEVDGAELEGEEGEMAEKHNERLRTLVGELAELRGDLNPRQMEQARDLHHVTRACRPPHARKRFHVTALHPAPARAHCPSDYPNALPEFLPRSLIRLPPPA